MKKVTVIIPTYNRAKYITQAIDSVLDQTYTNIEIIIVDDGSTDNTYDVILPYKDRIKYVLTENGGVAKARNIGFKHATGEYLAILDSDDLYYPDKIDIQVDFLEKNPEIGLIYTNFSGFDDNGFFDEFHLQKYHSSAYLSGAITYDKIFTEELNYSFKENKRYSAYTGNIFNSYFKNIIVFTNSIMFRKEILDKVGMQSTEFGFFHDLEFVLRITKYFRAGFLDIPTYKLRYHEGQISGTDNKDGINTVIKKQEDLIKVGEAYGINDPEYYLKNKKEVQKKMARLHKALAIPLLGAGREPKRARNNLKKSGIYGYREPFLVFLTYLPYILRRIGLKLYLVLCK